MNNYIQLLGKYNVPGPRYTSYPTVPYWNEETYNTSAWTSSVLKSTSDFGNELSLYIHLPYCESLCTFCGCNKRITKNHAVERPYIEGLLKEWELYLKLFDKRPVIKEIHLGGGTPTFFNPENLQILIEGLLKHAGRHFNSSFAFEANPVNTSEKHLQTLFDLGFDRLSLGIQDFDPKVQFMINRMQSFDLVKEVTDNAREIGYKSINYDVIYGLPFQTKDTIRSTFEKVMELNPDRIAYYSYAHVPWIKGTGQRRFSESDLPKEDEKRSFYDLGREMLMNSGYMEIGMDHFGRPGDELLDAVKSNSLHRNFMGYVPFVSKTLIGLGVSSISDSWYGFSQNIKDIDGYLESVNNNQLPLLKGHILGEEDLEIRQLILDIMCRFQAVLPGQLMNDQTISSQLQELENDGIIYLQGTDLFVTPLGRAFVRNVCMVFDLRLKRSKPEVQLFSMTV
ncbi:oxygen-independent coproporphyrinogen III oxidase [Reichenbachiella sp. MALMAid0571]|uniref:oxygen-independent coproporphyrinogen III oxidase n=1 Tax=Reichenbachiella sp. MALMAid0571 TaxID=3143939 RepID=UPI0032E01FC3